MEIIAYRCWASRLGGASPSKGEVSLPALRQLRDDEASAPTKLLQQQQQQVAGEPREAKEVQVEEVQELAVRASVATAGVNQVVVAEKKKYI